MTSETRLLVLLSFGFAVVLAEGQVLAQPRIGVNDDGDIEIIPLPGQQVRSVLNQG